MFLIERKNGHSHSYQYTALWGIHYKNDEIELRFLNAEVTIKGRALRPLYDALRKHNVAAIYEAARTDTLSNFEDKPVITEITYDDFK